MIGCPSCEARILVGLVSNLQRMQSPIRAIYMEKVSKKQLKFKAVNQSSPRSYLRSSPCAWNAFFLCGRQRRCMTSFAMVNEAVAGVSTVASHATSLKRDAE